MFISTKITIFYATLIESEISKIIQTHFKFSFSTFIRWNFNTFTLEIRKLGFRHLTNSFTTQEMHFNLKNFIHRVKLYIIWNFIQHLNHCHAISFTWFFQTTQKITYVLKKKTTDFTLIWKNKNKILTVDNICNTSFKQIWNI